MKGPMKKKLTTKSNKVKKSKTKINITKKVKTKIKKSNKINKNLLKKSTKKIKSSKDKNKKDIKNKKLSKKILKLKKPNLTKKKQSIITNNKEEVIEVPISKMSSEQRKQLAQTRLPKRQKPSKKKEEKIKEVRRQLLKDPVIRQNLIDLAGEHALALVQEFTYEMSDDDLSRKIKVKVSEIRSTLNKLHNKGIVTYCRSKDSETGWYSYVWTFHQNKIAELLEQKMNEEKQTQESNQELYFCSHCSLDEEIPFEDAVDLKFRCPVCSTPLSYKEKRKL
ncbi:MAG: hypothetical protein WC356_00910 [Candidatus Micrarchaeia archaeon]|jgi:transcription initiation factor TFIIE subunit alpha